MKIGVVGTGYVGLVQGVILSEFGLEVTCVDTNIEKIEMLKNGGVPIYEPGLEPLLKKNIEAGRLQFTSEIKEAVETSEVLFIAVGTPPADDGSADLRYVLEVANSIGEHMNGYRVVVDKSTVPVGTGKLVKETIQKKLDERGVDFEFDVVSNPEFLREGKAVNDCLRPDRVVIGYSDERAKEMMKKVYNVLYINETPFVFTSVETAEMIKYASNAFLAVKISFINEMALLAEKVGADVQQIAKAMGQDGRISPKFLHAGPGYGGSCFPKDTKAIVDIAKKYGEEFKVIDAAIQANEKQKQKMVEKIVSNMGSVENKVITVLGLSFKPETDDMRDAPSIDIIRGLVKNGARIKAYCPEGIKEAKWRLKDIEESIEYCDNEYIAVKDADATVIITEWNQFRGISLSKVKDLMKGNYLFDLRNIYSKSSEVKKIFNYYGVGKG
ncbi:MAG: UDP-glucose/GDP-mannose dehydrogenase family protein [Leptotrichiaceae bacterium]|jgi:UDPglucose 6-dehydrogenase|nr:UDP-glucose/GDP-mannose dehydrogenase family protein [Leptotrichiaceae bacterium]MBP8637478.1 UDP-glucose/GDP-mannose dehydrogenase family protein [Leptotrichiaceae bacterium]MBP9539355.1 UDP-glucose/GDP-mannose dehydrogenase family protein [Leptotrichiaceae bacterium]MBP9876439.1 UDP-glucose/GDP-mannose dehydrogenase family protein [Leptotrichiaceae bacterium]